VMGVGTAPAASCPDGNRSRPIRLGSLSAIDYLIAS
jgi:hypothetical protein